MKRAAWCIETLYVCNFQYPGVFGIEPMFVQELLRELRVSGPLVGTGDP